ncbi:MAG: hypothetical protein ACI4HO_03520 [Ruminococcus sp.]
MTEIDKIARAQMYLEKLANGINPLDGTEVPENDTVNNVRISRCMFYVSDILKQIVDNKGKYKVEMPDRVPFSVTSEQLLHFQFSDTPLSISEITKRINALIDTMYVRELKLGSIAEWLVSINMLSNITVNNKTRRIPTESGKNLGITTEERIGQYGQHYEAVLYNRNAQQFIIDNIDAVININNEKANK